ncbi:hypothetical protein [Streptomyces sp. NPDC058694]
MVAARAAENDAWRDPSLSTDCEGLRDFTGTKVVRMVRPDRP